MACLTVASRLSAVTVLTNGGFDFGDSGWHTSGGASVIASGDLHDNPFSILPDGALVFLYQTSFSPAPQLALTFDFFTGLMSPSFPSPGGFPDTAFASVYFGADESAVNPGLFLAASALALFDYDAVNGLQTSLGGALIGDSPARPGWSRFSARVDVPADQGWFALSFQNLNANGIPGDSAFLVDNLEAIPVPEATRTALLLAGGVFFLTRRRKAASV
jgi:hypothetical protein